LFLIYASTDVLASLTSSVPSWILISSLAIDFTQYYI
jgi:hypothetical protein